jgi:hypothetical protein
MNGNVKGYSVWEMLSNNDHSNKEPALNHLELHLC